MPNMPLSKNQIKFLRAKCHNLKPVVMLGQKGLTEEVLKELEIALTHHELIKIKLSEDEKSKRANMVQNICQHSGSEVVQQIGKTLSVYRQNTEKPVITLPDN